MSPSRLRWLTKVHKFPIFFRIGDRLLSVFVSFLQLQVQGTYIQQFRIRPEQAASLIPAEYNRPLAVGYPCEDFFDSEVIPIAQTQLDR